MNINSLRQLAVSVVLKDSATRSLRNVNKITDRVRDALYRFGRQASQSNEQVSESVKQMQRVYRDANGRLRNELGRFVAETRNATKSTQKLQTSVNGTSDSLARFSSNASQSMSSLRGIAAGALGAVSAYQTLGRAVREAAQFEQSKVLIEAMFDGKKASDAYMKMMEKLAADSPILNSQDMFANSKSFISLSKNTKVLEQAWKVVEKLNVMDPKQGVEGAVLALRELAGGDVVSLVERFEMPRSVIKSIKDLPFEQQVKAMDKILANMNITDEVVKRMGNTTLSQWNKFKELTSVAFREAGNSANSELGGALRRVNEIIEKGALNSFIRSADALFGKTIHAIVNFGSTAKRYIQPVAKFFEENTSSIKAVAVSLGSLFVISKVSGLIKGLFGVLRSNPFVLIATGAALLLDKFVGIDKVIDVVKNAFSGLYDVVMSLYYDTGEVDDILTKMGLSPELAQNISTFLQSIRDAFQVAKQAVGEFVNQTVVPLLPQAKDFIIGAFEAAKPSVQVVTGLFRTVMSVIRALIEKVIIPLFPVFKDVISTAFKIVTPIVKSLNRILQITISVVMFLVNNVVIPLIPKIAPIIQTMWKTVKPILETMVKMFDAISGAIEWATKKFKQFSDFASNFKMPKIGLPKWMGGKGLIQVPGHATGLSSVPYDNYIARLHKDETVLRADQARALEQAGILDRSGHTPRINPLGTTPSSSPKAAGGSVVFSPKVDIHVTAADVKSAGSLEAAVNRKLEEMWQMFMDIYATEVVR